MKKIIRSVLAVMLCFGMIPASAAWADEEKPEASSASVSAPVSASTSAQTTATFASLAEAEEAGAVASVPDDPEAYVSDEILVVLAGEESAENELASAEDSIADASDTASPGAVEAELLTPEPDGSAAALVELPDDVAVKDALLQLANDEHVAFAQPNFRYMLLDDESSESEQTASEATPEATPEATSSIEPLDTPNDPKAQNSDDYDSQWWLSTVNAFSAWDVQKTNGAVTVAVIDTGARLTHSDLDDNLLVEQAYDAHLNQPLTTSYGNNGDASPIGHGTHVTGIIAAEANNGLLGAGVSYNAKVLPITVFDNGGAVTSTVELRTAYVYILAHRFAYNIRVVNMSLGGYGSEDNDPLLHDKITEAKNAGILTVCSAGNNGSDSAYKLGGDNSNDNYPCYPGDYDEVISVVNVDKSLNRASSSDYNEYKDIAAPGMNIYSTAFESDSAFGPKSGTSMAAPIVSGIAALLFAKNPSLTPDQVKQLLYSTATDKGTTGWDKYYGWGVVNASAALNQLATYTVTFNPSGGIVSPTTVSRAYGAATGTLPVPTRTGYTFNGWYTATSGGTKISASTTVTTNVTYYARWTIKKYTVTLNATGGTVSPTSYPDKAYNTTIGSLPTPARKGYSFLGWYTSASGGTLINASIKVTTNATYYAHWKAKNGWEKASGEWYYFRNGTTATGWLKTGGSWYYLDSGDGSMYRGVHRIDGGWFAFYGGDNGRMMTGWQKLTSQGKTSWYYFRGGDSGRALTGWQKISGSWYYLDTSTAQMATGVHKINGSWFALRDGDSGRMMTGWQKLTSQGKTSWYYFRGGDDGRAYTGWKKIGGLWYHFDSSARMQTGWQYLSYNGKKDWYYFRGGDSGRMVSGTCTIGGKRYVFSSGGALLSPARAKPLGIG